MTVTADSIHSQLNALMSCDRRRIVNRLRGLSKVPEAKRAKILKAIELDRQQAEFRYSRRRDSMVAISYPDELPVSQKRAEIAAAIADHQVVIIAGETGSGKTTQIPKICLELGLGIEGVIGHTQPRRIAARSVATRIAEELKCELGQQVGYKVRFSDHSRDTTLVKLMTDGILLSEMQQDRALSQYQCLIIDEAHERSLNIDFIIGYLKRLLPTRPDLKVIITSATLDPERFSHHFNGAPIIEVSGRTYPVEVRYRPLHESDFELSDGIVDAAEELWRDGPGDILVFLNGEREIRDTAEYLNRHLRSDAEVLPLFSRLSVSEQNRIFASHGGRRIVLSTNIAETSLTVPGIRYVIDSGTARISRYSARTKVQRLPIEAISQASGNQRKGRCGRVADGICIRLYSEEDFNARPEFTDPEILRTNLAAVVLQMLALGLGDIGDFPFVEPPEQRNISDGIRLLEELGAIEQRQGRVPVLTTIGRQLAMLPIDPRLGRMVLASGVMGCLHEVMVITAALSVQDPRERPLDKQQAADEKHRRFVDEHSDFITLLNLWDYLQQQQEELTGNQFRRLCLKEFLAGQRVREWQDIYSQLKQAAQEVKLGLNQEPGDAGSIHRALMTGLLSHLGMRSNEAKVFSGARNSQFYLFPGSALFKKPPKWVMAAELVETSKLYGRIAARIEPDWIESLCQHLVKRSYSEPHWEKKRGAVIAFEKQVLFGLPIVMERRVDFGRIDPQLSRELFIRFALVEGEINRKYPFLEQNRALLEELESLEHKSRRRDILVSDEVLCAFYDERLPPECVSLRHFDSWWKKEKLSQPELLNFEREMLLQKDISHVSELDYPDYWYQGKLKLPLSYQFEPGKGRDGVTIHIPLPLLNQVRDQGFDWQVPGVRKELVIAWIKSLPKSLRRNLVPAPEYAGAFLAAVTDMDKPLLDTMEALFRRMTGVTISRESWDQTAIADHLRFNFCVNDPDGRRVAEGRDLHALKVELEGAVRQSLSEVVTHDIERDNIEQWDFGTLPQVCEQKRGGFSIKAYPALCASDSRVAIELFDSQHAQMQAMEQGLRQLLMNALPSPVKYLQQQLPNKAKLGLYFNPYGQVNELIDDCIRCGCDQLIRQFGGPVWQQDAFFTLKEQIRPELNGMVVDVALKVEAILSLSYELRKKLKGKIVFELAFAMSDIRQQLDHLIYKGFVTATGWPRLAHLLRYLKGIERRLEKLPIDPRRDRAHQLKINVLEGEYQQLLGKLPPRLAAPQAIADIRWMLEELRISFFAQQLGTEYPVSEKRIRQAMELAS